MREKLVDLLSVHPVESAVGCAVSVGIVIVDIHGVAVVCPFKPEAAAFVKTKQRLLYAEHELVAFKYSLINSDMQTLAVNFPSFCTEIACKPSGWLRDFCYI